MRAPGDEVERAIGWAQAGDPAGFDALFRVFGAPVAGYLRTHGVADPDDIANGVFLRAFKNIHTFRGDASRFRSWLFTIAHNAAVDEARRRRRRVTETPLPATFDAPAHDDVESQVAARIAHDRVRYLLQLLSPDQRDVLVLRIVADLTVEETAAVIGKSYEAVKALQRRGLSALQRVLAERAAVPR